MEPRAICEADVAKVYRRLGLRPPSLAWAKVELLGGLGAAALGAWLQRCDDALAAVGAERAAPRRSVL